MENLGEGIMSAQFAISHHLISVNDYHRMADAGIFTEDQPIELINVCVCVRKRRIVFSRC